MKITGYLDGTPEGDARAYCAIRGGRLTALDTPAATCELPGKQPVITSYSIHYTKLYDELTQALKDVVEGNFPLVWVRGEVSGLAKPASGHVYFSLKDADAVLSVVWFRRTREAQGAGAVNPLTGEVSESGPAELADGAAVLVAGRLTVYPPRGSYQLVAELVEEQGAGALALAFEALKRELSYNFV